MRKRDLVAKPEPIFFLFGFDAKFLANAFNMSSESGSTSRCFLQIHPFVNCIGIMGFQLSLTNFGTFSPSNGGNAGGGGGGGGGVGSGGRFVASLKPKLLAVNNFIEYDRI